MKQSVKAALFSAFVLPGSGHFLLKKHIQGALFSGVTFLCFWVLLSTALDKAEAISLKIQSGEIPLDLSRITDEVSKQAAGGGTQLAEIATYLLLICWLVAIVDSFWLGWKLDKENSRRDNQA